MDKVWCGVFEVSPKYSTKPTLPTIFLSLFFCTLFASCVVLCRTTQHNSTCCANLFIDIFCFVCHIFLYWFPILHLLQRECDTKILSLVIQWIKPNIRFDGFAKQMFNEKLFSIKFNLLYPSYDKHFKFLKNIFTK
jgi:hypothetical protein